MGSTVIAAECGVGGMKIKFLGTGTSVGVPVIGCDCAVCISSDSRNVRRRTSLYVQAGGVHVVIDTPPDFREQALTFAVSRVDAVLLTHSHADHIFGFDDIRRFNTIQDCLIPVYGAAATLDDMRRIFNYVHQGKHEKGLYRPRTNFVDAAEPFDIGGLHVVPLEVVHGDTPTLGYLLESEGKRMGYFPDCGEMSEETIERIRGVDVMVLDALRHWPHPTHMTVEESIGVLKKIGAGQSYIIHLCHDLDHEETERRLPYGIGVSYDGQEIEL